MSNRKASKINIPMFVACVLLCLTLISVHMLGGIYAKYISKSEGDDSARVAKFSITDGNAYLSAEPILEIAPGERLLTVEVENNSEVAVDYIVTFENMTDNIPLKFSVGGSEPQLFGCSVPTALAPGASATVTAKVIFEKEGALGYIGMVDKIGITLTAEQID